MHIISSATEKIIEPEIIKEGNKIDCKQMVVFHYERQ